MGITTRYKICVRLPDTRPLTFIVDEYTTDAHGFVSFIDNRTNLPRKYDGRICEIEEVRSS